MDQRISMVTLGVGDLKASTAFFERLGWRVAEPRMETVTFFDLNGVILGLYPFEDLAREVGAPPVSRGSPGMAVAYNARDRSEVDRVLAEAREAGGRLLKPAEEVFWGGYSGYFEDPNGHLFEVAHNPFWTVDENGRVWMTTTAEFLSGRQG